MPSEFSGVFEIRADFPFSAGLDSDDLFGSGGGVEAKAVAPHNAAQMNQRVISGPKNFIALNRLERRTKAGIEEQHQKKKIRAAHICIEDRAEPTLSPLRQARPICFSRNDSSCWARDICHVGPRPTKILCHDIVPPAEAEDLSLASGASART
jgi:hypothetical protein